MHQVQRQQAIAAIENRFRSLFRQVTTSLPEWWNR